MSSSSLVFSITIAVLLILAQVNQTSTKSVLAITSKDERDNNKVSPFLHNKEDVSLNEVMINKKDAPHELDERETGRAKKKYSYYYLGRSVLYFILYYQLFYNFYFLAHVVRSAFLHRVLQPPGHLEKNWEKVLPPWMGDLVHEKWPLYNKRDGGRGFEFDNEQLEPTYEINQEGIHNLTMMVLNAIKKFSKNYNDAST